MDMPRHRGPGWRWWLVVALLLGARPSSAQDLTQALQDLGRSLVDAAGCRSEVKANGKPFATMSYKGRSFSSATQPNADGEPELVLRYQYSFLVETTPLNTELVYDVALPLSQVAAERCRIAVLGATKERDIDVTFDPPVFNCIISFQKPLAVPLRTIKTAKGEPPSEQKSNSEQRFVGVLFARKEAADECLARLKRAVELAGKPAGT